MVVLTTTEGASRLARLAPNLWSRALQERLEDASASVLACAPADRLWRDIRKYLIHASDQHLIRQSEQDLHALLRRPLEADFARLGLAPAQGVRIRSVAVGAVRNFHRRPELPHLTRSDARPRQRHLLLHGIRRTGRIRRLDPVPDEA